MPTPAAGVEAAAGQEIRGLEALLKSINLHDQLRAATAWCVEQGADTVADLADEEVYAEQLATALKLPPIKATKLKKAIKAQSAPSQSVPID